MKKILMILMIAVGASSIASGQTKMSNDSKLEKEILAIERQTNEAYKNKDTKMFDALVPADALIVTETGIQSRTQFLQAMTADECKVNSFSMEDAKFAMLDKNTMIIAYKYVQDANCNGQPTKTSTWISSLYTKRNGKWLNTFFSLTPAK
jgi:hypothetical protein